MALKNYKVEYADGETQYFQADVDDEGAGRNWKDAMDAAVKNDDSPVLKVTQADPPKTNAAIQESGKS